MLLSEKIMILRKKKGWSQEELAEKLKVSRQSVSKWESAASVPDIERILQLSSLFGVSTDYLLKEEENSEIAPREEAYEEPEGRVVSMEEADRFMSLTRKYAIPRAIAGALCVLSPIPLLLLAGFSELAETGISEDMGGGLGMTFLLLMVAVGVAVFVFTGVQLEKYEYMEKEELTLQYGVKGIAAKKKEEFAGTYNLQITAGVVLCILGVIPLMISAAFSAADIVYVYCVCGLLGMVAVAVFLFIWAGSIRGSYDKLLQEGDYTPEKKLVERKTSFFAGAYWCLTVAIFLAAGFLTENPYTGFKGNNWKIASLIWPVAALLFVVIQCILKGVVGARQDKG